MSKLNKKWLACAFGALIAVSLGLTLLSPKPAWDKLVRDSYDLCFSFNSPHPPEGIVIVYLDEASHKELKQSFTEPWDRAIHARLLRKLTAEQAKAVVFDIVFSGPGPNARADEEFASAIKNNGKVILGGEMIKGSNLGVTNITLYPPFENFSSVAAAWGLVELPVDRDDTVRQQPPDEETRPSLAHAAAGVVNPSLKVSPTGLLLPRWLNYYGPPGTLPSVSYSTALDGVPPGFFKDKIVFIGARQSTDFTGAGKDEFGTGYTWISGTYSPGVEIQATAFLNLLRNDGLTRHPAIEKFLIVMLGLLAGFGLTYLRTWQAALAALAGIIVIALTSYALFHSQLLLFSWMVAVAQWILSLAWSASYNSLQDYIKHQVLERTLSIHVSPRRVRQLLKRPELLKPGAEKHAVSFMFTDIADFSTISDRMVPEKLFQHLNNYFEKTISSIHQHDGTVVQLIGDAIFAIWNAPEPQANHQELSCRAALALRDKLVEFEAENKSFPFHTRVGLHSGEACVGNCGSEDRFVYTAIGANTNLASRLEALNKHVGTSILASDTLIAAVENHFTTRSVGHFRLKGVDRVIEIYELVGLADCREKTKAWRDAFASGLQKFRQAEFDGAETVFKEVIALRGKDGPSEFYLKHIREFREHPPAKGWFGEIKMDEK